MKENFIDAKNKYQLKAICVELSLNIDAAKTHEDYKQILMQRSYSEISKAWGIIIHF